MEQSSLTHVRGPLARGALGQISSPIRPRPAFRPLFEFATTREGSGIVLVSERDLKEANQPPPHGHEADANSCSWWRRGRVELHREHGTPVLVAA